MHRGGRGGPPRPARERHAQQWGMGGKEGVLGARPLPPAHQNPGLSRRTSPVLLSRRLPHQRSSTYPLSGQARGAGIAPGTLRAVLARVPRVPLPGKGTVVRGYCPTATGANACAEPVSGPTLSTSAYVAWFKGRVVAKVSKYRHGLKKEVAGLNAAPGWPDSGCRRNAMSSAAEPGAS